jgi:choline-sulfatase
MRTLGALGLALAGLAAATSVRPQGPPKPSFVLITLDTTRADHLGSYGDAKAETPVLDRLASQGVLFEEAHSNVPLTLPSHATILTGDLPSTLNLRVNGLNLKEGAETLAQRLKAGGWWTGAVVSSVILSKERGLARGFGLYNDRMTTAAKPGAPPEERPAAETTEAALQAVQGVKPPYFLWVHYYDPHSPYRPPPPFASTFAARPYDGEIASMDAAVGRLLEGLTKAGLMKDTLVVVAGDHGEGLGDHGEEQHGVFLYESTMHVPLILSWKGRLKPGLRVPDLCGLDDVAPTVLDLMGVQAAGMDGRSLRPLLEGRSLPGKEVYIESYHGFFTYGWAPLRGIMDGALKFIHAPKAELYEWKKSEAENLFKPSDPRVAALKKALERYPAADKGEEAEMERFLKDPSNAETLRQLMSLGYLSGGGARPDTAGLLDPKDAIGIESELQQVQEWMDLGEVKKGTESLLKILKRNPANIPALSMLGIAYLNAGQFDKAKACFQEEVRLKPQMDTAHLNLGTAMKKLGQLQGAEKEYRAALALSPAMAEAASSLAQVLQMQGRTEEARKVVESALASGAQGADLYFELGVLEASAAHWERARYGFTKALSLDPRRDEALANLGGIAYQTGNSDEAIACYERAARLAPRNVNYLATLGSLYLNAKNDPRTALRWYRRALAADPYGKEAPTLREIVQGLEASEAE